MIHYTRGIHKFLIFLFQSIYILISLKIFLLLVHNLSCFHPTPMAQAVRSYQHPTVSGVADTEHCLNGLLKFSGRNGQICEAHKLGKQHRLPFPNERNRSWNQLDLIHSDV